MPHHSCFNLPVKAVFPIQGDGGFEDDTLAVSGRKVCDLVKVKGETKEEGEALMMITGPPWQNKNPNSTNDPNTAPAPPTTLNAHKEAHLNLL